jgi:hypothetical protein
MLSAETWEKMFVLSHSGAVDLRINVLSCLECVILVLPRSKAPNFRANRSFVLDT